VSGTLPLALSLPFPTRVIPRAAASLLLYSYCFALPRPPKALSRTGRARARATFPSVRLARTMTPTPYTTQPPINVVRLMDDGSPPPPSPTPTTPCQPPDA
ncbi:uncharacterized protein CCOS01_11321, partial [Colletotrichum costaricense]